MRLKDFAHAFASDFERLKTYTKRQGERSRGVVEGCVAIVILSPSCEQVCPRES